jgi:Reversibly glycosylated polypeptide
MQTALILTTINIPTVLSLYRAHDPDVRFFVAVDKKTPPEAWSFLEQFENLELVYGGAGQYACSDLIGWNQIARRNIALLEALEWGADVIVSIDDDNIPLDPDYFCCFRNILNQEFLDANCFLVRRPFNGIQAKATWFDPGSLCFPTDGKPVVQRGFPQQLERVETKFAPVTSVKIGVAQGMILGNPDTSGVDRLSRHPQVHQVSELLRSGVVTDPRETYAPLNSQNIAFTRDVAPCFLMVPAFGRYDDIYASLIAQRVMREHDLFVHYGQPFVWQQRNPHDLLKDLKAEQWGAEHILDFTAWLDGFILPKKVPAVEAMKILFTNLPDWMPERGKLQELALAWCSDCESVMK